MRRTSTLAAVALTLALSASACSGDDQESDLPKVGSGTSASPSPSATPSWSATAKPQRPEDEQTQESAQAFTQFVADTVLYVMATGDAPALSSIASLATCDECGDWDDNYNNGKITKLMIADGPASYEPAGKQKVSDKVFRQVSLTMDIPTGTSVRKDTGKKITTVNAAKDLPFTADIQWKDEQWLLMRYKMG